MGIVLPDGTGSTILLCPHEIPSERGAVMVDGPFTHAYTIGRLDPGLGSSASGWAVLDLDTPIGTTITQTDLEFDFTTPIPPGDPVSAVYGDQTAPPRSAFEVNYDKEIHAGRVVVNPPPQPLSEEARRRLSEFLLVEAAWPQGASGSPVLWFPPGSERPVIVGIVAGGLLESRGNVVVRPAGLDIPAPSDRALFVPSPSPAPPIALPIGSIFVGHALFAGSRSEVWRDPAGAYWIRTNGSNFKQLAGSEPPKLKESPETKGKGRAADQSR